MLGKERKEKQESILIKQIFPPASALALLPLNSFEFNALFFNFLITLYSPHSPYLHSEAHGSALLWAESPGTYLPQIPVMVINSNEVP